MIGAVTIAAYRSARRRGQDLGETVAAVEDALAELGPEAYATAVFGQLDLRSGAFSYLNVGHPSPLLVRNAKVVKSLDGGRRSLFGLRSEIPRPATEQLEPGDWIVFYTDGVTEARDPSRAFFGLDRLIGAIERCAADRQNAPDTLRRTVSHVLEHQRGVLQDDATMLVVQWASGHERDLRSA